MGTGPDGGTTVAQGWRRKAGVLRVGAVVVALAAGAVSGAGPADAAGSRLVFSLSNVNGADGVAYRLAFGPVGLGVPVVGNWDRASSGRDTVGVSLVDGDSRRWVLAAGNSSADVARDFGWGDAGCLPVAGDWQGRGDTVGQVCAAGHTWRWTLARPLPASGAPGTYRTYDFGDTACTPVVGDWNGDGVSTVGVSCPDGANRTWTLTDDPGDGTHAPEPTTRFAWGSPRCVPVTGDWDGLTTAGADGDTVGQACVAGDDVWHWQLANQNAAGPTDTAFAWGSSRQVPLTGDWDGVAGTADRDTPGSVAGVNYPAVAGPAPNPYGPAEVRTGWTPRTTYTADQVRLRFAVRSCGGQADGSDSGHVPGSDHYSGNAADCMVEALGTIATGSARDLGDSVADWVVRYGPLLRVKYVIWYARIYDFQTADPSWQPYCNSGLTADQCAHPTPGTVATLQHYDHVHVSLLH